MTQREKQAAMAVQVSPCAWRTGDRRCLVAPAGGRRCAWHTYWLRLVEVGALEEADQDTLRALGYRRDWVPDISGWTPIIWRPSVEDERF